MVARLRVDESEYYIDTGLTNLSTIHTCTGTGTDESKYYGNFVSVPYLVEPRAFPIFISQQDGEGGHMGSTQPGARALASLNLQS